MKKSLFELITEFVLGRKYYVNIIVTEGTDRYEATSYIFDTKAGAEGHRDRIGRTLSFRYVETVSFRSRNVYPHITLSNPESGR